MHAGLAADPRISAPKVARRHSTHYPVAIRVPRHGTRKEIGSELAHQIFPVETAQALTAIRQRVDVFTVL